MRSRRRHDRGFVRASSRPGAPVVLSYNTRDASLGEDRGPHSEHGRSTLAAILDALRDIGRLLSHCVGVQRTNALHTAAAATASRSLLQHHQRPDQYLAALACCLLPLTAPIPISIAGHGCAGREYSSRWPYVPSRTSPSHRLLQSWLDWTTFIGSLAISINDEIRTLRAINCQ